MKKWPKTRIFFFGRNNECLPNFKVFNENEFLETSNDLDDSEISLFIEENRNVNKTKKTKTDLNVWKRWCEFVKETKAIEELSNIVNITFLCQSQETKRTLSSTIALLLPSEISTATSSKTKTRGF